MYRIMMITRKCVCYFTSLKGAVVKINRVEVRMINCVPLLYMGAITYPCPNPDAV